MRRFIQFIAGVGAVAAAIVSAAGPASAAGDIVALTCGEDTFTVGVNGNGEWTPARDTESTSVFHPTAFGEFTGTFTPSDGGDPETFTEPPLSRKNVPANGRPILSCTYHIEFADESGTFFGDGSVIGWTSGSRQN